MRKRICGRTAERGITMRACKTGMHYEVRVWHRKLKSLIFVGSSGTLEGAKIVKYSYLSTIGQT